MDKFKFLSSSPIPFIMARSSSLPPRIKNVAVAHRQALRFVASTAVEARPCTEAPGDRKIPIFSFLKDIITANKVNEMHIRFFNAFRKYGDVVRLPLFANEIYIISNPYIVEEICRQESALPRRTQALESTFREFHQARRNLQLAPGLLESEGEEWAALRSVLSRRLLRPMEVKNYLGGFCSASESLVAEIKKNKGSDGIIEDFRDYLGRWSLESISTFAFGKRVGLISRSDDHVASRIYEKLQDLLWLSMLLSSNKLVRYIFPGKLRQLEKGMEVVYTEGMKLVMATVEKIKNSTDLNEDIEKSLVAYLMTKDKLSARDVVTHAVDAFIAGLDTTTSAAGWLLYLLSLNPEVQDQLHQEIKECIPKDTAVTHSMIQRMPYLRACMKESARLYPTAVGFVRVEGKPLLAGGYSFPPNTVIHCSNYNMARNEKAFPDALAFKPERWFRASQSQGASDPPSPFASLPFGHGARSCVGRRIAEAEIQCLVIYLLKNFRLRYLGEEQIGKMNPVLTHSKPLKVAFEPRCD